MYCLLPDHIYGRQHFLSLQFEIEKWTLFQGQQRHLSLTCFIIHKYSLWICLRQFRSFIPQVFDIEAMGKVQLLCRWIHADHGLIKKYDQSLHQLHNLTAWSCNNGLSFPDWNFCYQSSSHMLLLNIQLSFVNDFKIDERLSVTVSN